MTTPDVPVLPQYGGPCISSIVPALLEPAPRTTSWLPAALRDARQIVLLVIDGLGWHQLREHAQHAPCLASMEGDGITSVVPTTTPTALCSIVYGTPPSVHGVVGFNVAVPSGVLHILSWRTAEGDARATVPPAEFATGEPFLGHEVPVLTRGEFAGTGFTTAMHRRDNGLVGWWAASSLAIDVKRVLGEGHPLVYAYYDGVDRIAHVHGLGDHYDAELRAIDRVVSDIVDALPPGAALVVTADHGQVEMRDGLVALDGDITADVAFCSGEPRMRWLHARDGRADALAAKARRYEEDGRAWVRTTAQTEAEGWFGGELSAQVRSRLGDVVLAARAPLGFIDPSQAGRTLACRHGSLTAAEMWVPLIATAR